MKPLYSRGRDRFKKLLLSIAKPTAHMDMAHAAEPLPGAPPDSPPGKPAWRCFSYDEIHRATNGFHGGKTNQSIEHVACVTVHTAHCSRDF